jgi:hypothetical protein
MLLMPIFAEVKQKHGRISTEITHMDPSATGANEIEAV